MTDANAYGDGMPAKEIFEEISDQVITTKSLVNRVLYNMEKVDLVRRASAGETNTPYWKIVEDDDDSE